MKFRVPGPCTVAYGTYGAEATLGVQKTGVAIRTTSHWVPITDDAHGAVPADYLWAGRQIIVDIIGLDMAIIDALSIFRGGLGQNAVLGTIVESSQTGQALKITEKDGSSIWSAKVVEPMEPEQLLLSITQELQIPISFLVLPDADGKLFNAVPAYFVAGA